MTDIGPPDPSSRSLSRRRLLQGGLLGGVVLLEACSNRASPAPEAVGSLTPGGSVSGSGPAATAPATEGSSPRSRLLAYAEFNPPQPTEIVPESRTWTDVESRHLAVQFAGPPSGRVLVVINAVARNMDPIAYHFWGLRGTEGEAANQGLVANSGRLMMVATTASYRKNYRHLGVVTPGRDYRWTFAVRGLPERAVSIRCGRDPASSDAPEGFGPAHVEVWEA
jgi:hypothetical protein